ncbi:P-loop containing nucleoside triphosphate hydrolase protein [Zopfochytrium polystomum]|nr:P-loop containing nucleoside triphosphate hydrolase protein [Zopfochytrium polystomum]
MKSSAESPDPLPARKRVRSAAAAGDGAPSSSSAVPARRKKAGAAAAASSKHASKPITSFFAPKQHAPAASSKGRVGPAPLTMVSTAARSHPGDIIALDSDDDAFEPPPPRPAKRPVSSSEPPLVEEQAASSPASSSRRREDLVAVDRVPLSHGAVKADAAKSIAVGDPVMDVLKNVFKLNSFRGDQEEIIRTALKGQNILVLMPTGGGKSLTYQLPALIDDGVTLVVSPLLAEPQNPFILQENQVSILKNLKIPAEALNSSCTPSEKDRIYKDLNSTKPRTKLLYVTPELMATPKFRQQLDTLSKRNKLARLVVDEAHCISEWGHDFRDDYRKLSYFKTTYPHLPVLALTATATQTVQSDILNNLAISSSYKLFVSSFNRPNLHYEVRFKPPDNDPFTNMKDFILSKSDLAPDGKCIRTQCGVIYCCTRAACEELATRLQQESIRARAYHAGLGDKMRSLILEAWTTGGDGVAAKTLPKRGKKTAEEVGAVDIVIATIAFGMGIDKKDVRFVIHWDMAQSMEAYYQQAGRAGRDGEYSNCILYYSRRDRDRVSFLLQREQDAPRNGKNHSKSSDSSVKAFTEFIKYCENTKTCRHLLIVSYFGENIAGLSAEKRVAMCAKGTRCDVCIDPVKVARAKSMAVADDDGGYGYGGRRQEMDDGEIFVRFRDGTRGRLAGDPKAMRHQQEISLVEEIEDDDGGGGGNRGRDEGGGSRFAGGYSYGFQSARSTLAARNGGMNPDQDVVAWKREHFLGRTGPTTNYASAKLPSMRFPQLVCPYHHSIPDLALEDREKTFERFLAVVAKKLNAADDALPAWRIPTPGGERILERGERGEFVVKAAAEIEASCYIKSKNANLYKTYLMARMREVQAPAFGTFGASGALLTVAERIVADLRSGWQQAQPAQTASA